MEKKTFQIKKKHQSPQMLHLNKCFIFIDLIFRMSKYILVFVYFCGSPVCAFYTFTLFSDLSTIAWKS